VLEHRLDELGPPAPDPAPAAPPLERLRQLGEGALQQRHEVDRVAPGVRFLHPRGSGELCRQRAEHGLRPLPACDIERLECLVHEIERMTSLEVAVIGSRREQQVGQLVP